MTHKINDGLKETSFIDNGGELIIEQKQDITSIIEANKAEYNQSMSRSGWSDDAFGNKVASIPLTVFAELDKQGITRGFTVIDMKRFKEWLNNPDNQVFRTRLGRI